MAGYLLSAAAEKPWSIFELMVPLGLVQVFGIARPFCAYGERLARHDWVLRMGSALRAKLFGTLAGENILELKLRSVGDALGFAASDITHVQDLYIKSLLPLMIGFVVWLATVVLLAFVAPLAALLIAVFMGIAAVGAPLVSLLVQAAREEQAKTLRKKLLTAATDDILGLADWMYSGRRDDFVANVSGAAQTMHIHDAKTRSFVRRRDLLVQIVGGVAVVALILWANSQFAMAVAAVSEAQFSAWIPGAHDYIAAFAIGVFPLAEALLPMGSAASGISAHLDAIENLNGLENPRNGDVQETQAKPAPLPSLCLDHITYTYAGALHPAINNLSVTIPFGQKVCILGSSGSGKSTLLGIMHGDIVPDYGKAEIGGMTLASLGEHTCEYIGVVQQNPYVFDSSLIANLRIACPRATEEQCWQALERVGLREMAESLPHKLDTVLGEGGVRLSGGQRHRLALARILLADTPIVLLDEPFAALDPKTEAAVLKTLFDVLNGHTIVMVTHHLLGIENFDRVIFMQEGSIAHDGSILLDNNPAELVKASPRYRCLLSFDRGWTHADISCPLKKDETNSGLCAYESLI
ncbi:MAG: thiol reductant ABC exporter subunit CydC [Coriobacteriales bacterium]|nr:thiol reductant ABC exporter subunit CydC [Coriobacteriales bacterium]